MEKNLPLPLLIGETPLIEHLERHERGDRKRCEISRKKMQASNRNNRIDDFQRIGNLYAF